MCKKENCRVEFTAVTTVKSVRLEVNLGINCFDEIVNSCF
jgi:hypothetical protein